MIKSGGEWISSIELENVAMSHPQVLCLSLLPFLASFSADVSPIFISISC